SPPSRAKRSSPVCASRIAATTFAAWTSRPTRVLAFAMSAPPIDVGRVAGPIRGALVHPARWRGADLGLRAWPDVQPDTGSSASRGRAGLPGRAAHLPARLCSRAVLGTYLSFAVLTGAAAATGALVFRACGRREWSWLAPAVGLAVLCGAGWGAANLIDPAATLIVLLAALAYGAYELVTRQREPDEGIATGLITAVGALILGSIPFIVEMRFGILGTSLNPDMSQHLFAT